MNNYISQGIYKTLVPILVVGTVGLSMPSYAQEPSSNPKKSLVVRSYDENDNNSLEGRLVNNNYLRVNNSLGMQLAQNNEPCPPYLGDKCRKSTSGSSGSDNEGKKPAFSGTSPYNNSNNTTSNNNAKPSTSSESGTSHGGSYVAIGTGGLALLLGSLLVSSKSCSGYSDNYKCTDNMLTDIGYVSLVGGGILIVGGVIGLASK